MKFSKKRNQFEASNVTFSPSELTAYSYRWWKFLGIVNDVLIFNVTNYSPTTRKHQIKVMREMEKRGIEPQIVLKFTRKSLSFAALENEIEGAKHAIKELEAILINTRRKKALDDWRKNEVELLKEHIRRVEIVLHGTELNATMA